MRVALIQMEHGPSLEANLAAARTKIDEAAAQGAKLVLLPEYFFATFPSTPEEQATNAPRVRSLLQDASRSHSIAVAGNVIERTFSSSPSFLNVGLVYDAGALVLEQPKVHPMPREARGGVAGGMRFEVARAQGEPVGMLVCADILYPEASRILALRGARVLLNPVMSPYRADDDTKGARESIYVARAYDSAAFVLKAGGFRAGMVAGRSLAAAPWGVLARYRDEFAEEIVLADLDFARLDAFRKGQEGFPLRRPEAYEGLL